MGFGVAKSVIKVDFSCTDIKSVKDILFLLEKHKQDLPASLLYELEKLTESSPTLRCQMFEIVECVANIGVDFGYGPFYIDDSHIEKARIIVNRYETN